MKGVTEERRQRTTWSLLCVCVCVVAVTAGVARAEVVDVPVDGTHNVTVWGASENVTFRVTGAVENQTVQVLVLRRKPFYYTTSHMFLCPAAPDEELGLDPARPLAEACAARGLWSYTYDANGTAAEFTLHRTPRTYDTEVPVTIKACNESCASECPGDCGGAGGCDAHYHTCFCDAGYSLAGGSCVGEAMTSGRVALIVCMVLLAVIVVLVVVGLLFYFCESKAPKPKNP